MTPKKPTVRPRRAQLLAEAVAVCCPWCGEPQPSHNGSEFWTPEDFLKKSGQHPCTSCDQPILIFGDSKAQFARNRL